MEEKKYIQIRPGYFVREDTEEAQKYLSRKKPAALKRRRLVEDFFSREGFSYRCQRNGNIGKGKYTGKKYDP